MDIHFRDYGVWTDGSPCVCCAYQMANSGLVCLFTAGIAISESFCSATGPESTVNIFCFLL